MEIIAIDLDTLVRNWWVVLIRGLAAIAFGIITFVDPGLSLGVLVLLFGAYAFVDGLFAIANAVQHPEGGHRGWTLLQGIAGILAGVLTVVWPGITALVLLYLIAAWALVTGAAELAAAIHLRRVIRHEWLLLLSGLASIILGVLLFLFPAPGALTVVLWIGAYALVSGTLLTILAFRLRSLGRPHAPHARPAHA